MALVAGTAGATASWLGSPGPGAAVGYAAMVVGTVAVAIGVRIHRPPTADAWLLVAAGRAAAFTAASTWGRADQTTSVATIAHLAGLVAYACTGYGLILLARHLTRVWDRTRWIDSTVVAMAAGVTATGALLGSARPADAGWTGRWLLPSYPALGLLLVLLATRSLLAVKERSVALRLLTTGLVVQFGGSVASRWVAAAGVAVPDAVLATTTALSTVLIGAAALHPSVAIAPQRILPWRRLGVVRSTVLVSSLVAPLATLVVLAARGRAATSPVIALTLGAAAIGVLVLVRVSGLVRYADALADERHRSRFEALADHSHDAVVILDRDHTVTWASPAVRSVIGPSPESVVGRPLDALLGASTVADLARPLLRLSELATGATMEIRAQITDADGHERTLEGVATNLLAEPAVEGLVLVARDITERTEMQRQLVEQAFVDPLTGLANRALFSDRVGHALSRLRSHDDPRVAVLFIDLDDFKEVNDSLGHGRGDDLLVAVGRRIAEALRPSDTAARLGGDEFGVLVEDVDLDAALATASQILDLLRVPLLVGDFQMTVTASIGIAMADDPRATAAVLLRNADLAMYEAKRDGKGQARTFRSEMHERELRQFTFRSELQAALERDQLHLLYQPIVDMDTEEVTGAEALIRWTHPDHGLVSPLDFIPVAEATRSIIPIGRWVLRTACEQLAAWRDLGDLTMDVNVSAVQLVEPGFVADVAAVLADTGVRPDRLVLELTESILVHDADAALAVLEDLRALGVRLAIDDFGTGYSSLAYLQNFPIDIVKIDRAFVNQLGHAGRGRSLARSIIAIAGSLGIDTIAEGIETPAQAADLSALDCIHGQGFHYSRPVDPPAFAALFDQPLLV